MAKSLSSLRGECEGIKTEAEVVKCSTDRGGDSVVEAILWLSPRKWHERFNSRSHLTIERGGIGAIRAKENETPRIKN